MHTSDHAKKEIPGHHTQPRVIAMQSHHDIFFGVTSYLGPLIIIPLVISPENRFIKFHIHQGLVLFSLELAILALRALFGLTILYTIIHFLILVLAVMGISNVVHERQKNLPIIGELAKYFIVFT